MFFQRFYDDTLAQASYLIGCGATGQALVIDPNRDAAQYLRAAEEEDLRITHVTETHIHADFLSGTRELAHRSGAVMHLSDEGGPGWQYAFAKAEGAVLLHDGDHFMVGNIRFDVLHTPGHTPEHLAFVVTDTAGADAPMGVVTGDFLFVGDVGRPDLLEKAAKVAGSSDAAARALWASLEKFRALPDHLQVWPGHGAGSACGKGMSAVPQSTVGYEKRFNWALGAATEAEFVAQVLADQPEPPKYFAEMKRLNRDGPPLLGEIKRPPRLTPDRLPALLAEGATVVDARPSAQYAARHVPGTIHIPLGRSFTTWAGWLLSYDAPFYLLVSGDSPDRLDKALYDLALIGLDGAAGWFGGDAITAWGDGGRAYAATAAMTPEELLSRHETGEVAVVDVRGLAEWNAGHLTGVDHVPLGYLLDQIGTIPTDRPVVLHCQGGGRSLIAASLLESRGVTDVINLTGGFGAWQKAGLPVER
ncbi:MAG TPA: MBL fold metallo-hydrolase [Gemmatimonadales bacterium]|nr:MBL fold metallo-hydrolase [Gemmatimonadales bacterium]